MIKRLLIITSILFFTVAARAGTDIDSLQNFMEVVRFETNQAHNPLLTDAVLQSISHRAILYTSVDVGGVEFTFKIDTDTGQAFYAIPDTNDDCIYRSGLVFSFVLRWCMG